MHIHQAIELIMSGKEPEYHYLFLYNKQINDEQASALAHALSSGRAPKGLTIDLTNNKISEKGAKSLATALISGMAPERLQINLKDNPIGGAGLDAIITSIKTKKYPFGLVVTGYSHITDLLNAFAVEEKWIACIASTLAKAPFLPNATTALLSKKRGSLEQLNDDVLGDILSYLHPKAHVIVTNLHLFMSIRQAIKYHPLTNIKQNLITILKAKQYSLKMRHQVSALLTQEWIFDPDFPQDNTALFIQNLLKFAEDVRLSLTGMCQIVDALIKKIHTHLTLINKPSPLIETLAAYPHLTKEKKQAYIQQILSFWKNEDNLRSTAQPKKSDKKPLCI